MSKEKCLCCTVHQCASIAANYFMIVYGVVLGISVWWIIESQGRVIIEAYILVAIYFATFIFSILLVLSLAVQRRSLVLFIWMFIICVLFFPECGLNLWICLWKLDVKTEKGLGFLIFYVIRAAINIFCFVSVHSAYSSLVDEENIQRKRVSQHATTTYKLQIPLPRAYYFLDCQPATPIQNESLYPEYVPYSIANSFAHPAPTVSHLEISKPHTPLAAGMTVKYRINGDCHFGNETMPNGHCVDLHKSEKANKRDYEKKREYNKHKRLKKARDTPGPHHNKWTISPCNDHANPFNPKTISPISPISTSIYMLNPWRMNYPPLPPWIDSAPVPQPWGIAPSTPSEIAYTTQESPATKAYKTNHNRNGFPNVFQRSLALSCKSRNPIWFRYKVKLSKNPIPPGLVFDSRAPDVEASFGNFVMRQRRTGNLRTFRPKSLQGDELRIDDHHLKKYRTSVPAMTSQQLSCMNDSFHSDQQNRSFRRSTNKHVRRLSGHTVDQSRNKSGHRSTGTHEIMSSKQKKIKHQNRQKVKTTRTTTKSSYYRCQTTVGHAERSHVDSGAESNTTYGQVPVRIDDTTWTLM